MTDRRTARTWAEIDLDALAHNYHLLRSLAPDARFLGLVKANAYGHGAVQIARELERLDYVWGYAVATAEEAFILRRTGLKKQILLLGCAYPYHYEELICNDIQLTVFREDSIEELAACARRMKKSVRVHVKVETGMSRIGVMPDESGSWRRYCIRKVWCPRGCIPTLPGRMKEIRPRPEGSLHCLRILQREYRCSCTILFP